MESVDEGVWRRTNAVWIDIGSYGIFNTVQLTYFRQ